MNLQASFRFSDIFNRTITTASRLLQKDAVDSFSSCTRLFFVVMTPIEYNLQVIDIHAQYAHAGPRPHPLSPQVHGLDCNGKQIGAAV